jgi:hypothetical protein
MYERFKDAAGTNIVAISRRDLKVMDQALTFAQGLVPKQAGEDPSSGLEARVNVVCSQVYIVARILLALIEARSGRKTSIELLKTRVISDAGRELDTEKPTRASHRAHPRKGCLVPWPSRSLPHVR